MARSQDLIDSVADGNVKTVAEMASWTAAMAMQNFVAHQNRMNILAESALASSVRSNNELDPEQAAAIARTLTSTNNADIGGVVAALQQIVKAAQTTPPTTG